MAQLPLEGYRIVDMTEVWAGPFANSLLGDLGAEVIRVESYPRVAQSRPAQAQAAAGSATPGGNLVGGPDAPRPWDRASGYHMTNRNKLGITLNLADERGKEVFFRLIGVADGFIIGYTAGTASRMGLEYDVVRRYKPDLVMLSMPGWGERGPYKGYATFGSGADAWVGHHYLRGYPDLDPSGTRSSVHSDAPNAITIAFAMAVGLHYRDRTGKGQFIDLSQAEVLLTHLPRPYMDWVMNNRIDEPIGDVDPEIAPNGAYPCADPDSWIVLVVRTDAQWGGLKQALGSPAWADDPRLDSVLGRIRHREEIDARLREWTSALSAKEATQRLQAAGVPAGPVNNVDGPPADPQLAARGFYRWVTHPVTGQYRRPGPLFNLSATPVQFRRHTNLLGEHNHDVICGLLGLSESEYEDLVRANIIGESYDPSNLMDPEDRV